MSTMQVTVKVKMRYLVSVRDKTGKSEEEVSFTAGSTLGDAAEWLRVTHGLSVPSPHVMAILNGKGWGQFPEKTGTPLKEGDVISLFPPISGG